MKKKWLYASVCAVLLLAVCVGLGAALANENSPFYLFGQAESRKAEDQNDAKVITDRFYITNSEFERVKEGFLIGGVSDEEAEERAYDLLMRKYTAYSLATAAGFEVSDAEVRDIIEEQKAIFADPDSFENREDYEAFLEGAEMTNEEYWDTQFQTLKVYETIGQYQDALYQQYCLERGTTPGKNSEEWQSYYDAFIRGEMEKLQVEVAEKESAENAD